MSTREPYRAPKNPKSLNAELAPNEIPTTAEDNTADYNTAVGGMEEEATLSALDRPLAAAVDPTTQFRIPEKPYAGFAIGFDVTSAEELERKQKRASRFSVGMHEPVAEKLHISAEELARRDQRISKYGGVAGELTDEMLQELAVLDDLQAYPIDLSVERRWAVLHLHGLFMKSMATNEVLAYFKEYGPSYVEWIDDRQLNVVFADEFSAKRALMATTRKLPVRHAHTHTAPKPVEGGEEDAVYTPEPLSFTPEQLDGGVHWRVGVDSKKGSHLLMRIATTADRKLSAKERAASEYYRLHRKGYAAAKKNSAKRLRVEEKEIVVIKKVKQVQGDEEQGGVDAAGLENEEGKEMNKQKTFGFVLKKKTGAVVDLSAIPVVIPAPNARFEISVGESDGRNIAFVPGKRKAEAEVDMYAMDDVLTFSEMRELEKKRKAAAAAAAAEAEKL